MTDERKLRALIKKALDKGWDGSHYLVMGDRATKLEDYEVWNHYSTKDIIFNHDFARYLFGEEHTPYAIVWSRLTGKMPFKGREEDPLWVSENKWQYMWHKHLQQAVISTNPISYMYSTVFTEPNKN